MRRVLIAGWFVAVMAGCGTEGPGDPAADPDPSDDPSEVPAQSDICDNGLDDDLNGAVDDGCSCRRGDTQSCFPGDPRLADNGVCTRGSQTCVETPDGLRWGDCVGAGAPAAEICDDADNDCDGTIDNLESGIDCVVAVELPGGDCKRVTCPELQPFPVGCESLTFNGGDSRGCVANDGSPSVFVKEGNSCGSGSVTGSILCSQVAGTGLDAETCPMNKPNARYVTKAGACPD